MTSPDDDFGQASDTNNSNPKILPNNNNPSNNYNRRVNSNSSISNGTPAGIELRLLMTSRDAGAVIGKSGSSIQKLRADHPRTIIQVPDCDSPERILIISGDHDQCFDALFQIIPLLIDSSRLSSFNRRRVSNANENPSGGENPSEIRLLVHQIYCGAIIGKGGQNVKDLRQKFNLDVKVFSMRCPLSHERVISLRGKVEDIIVCIKHIYSLMNTSNQVSRGLPFIQYDPHNFDSYSVNEYGGFPLPGSIDTRLRYNLGDPYLASGPRGMNMYPIQSLPPLVDMSYGGGPGLAARYHPAVPLTSTRVTLPNELVGAIIGPRGAKIQQIRQITNANIIIDDQPIPNATGGGDRIITIEGTPDQISYAQALLQQAVRQSGLWRP